MGTTAVHILRRFLASGIRVRVDVPATLAARKQFPSHPDGVVATFEGSITLYRVFDGEELARSVKSGRITGGTYAAKAERAHGASWGENITALLEWGNRLRGGRYGDDIFLAKLDATDKRFYHMDPGIHVDLDDPSEQIATMDRAKISPALGASVMDVALREVDLFVVHPDHQIRPMSLEEAKDYVSGRPTKEMDLRPVHGEALQGQILGVDVRVFKNHEKWIVVTNDDRTIATNAPTKEDAIELARIAIKLRPERPVPTDFALLEQKRRHDKHFEQDTDPEKTRGTYALKPRDRVEVVKGSRALSIQPHSTLTVADVYQIRGERSVMVKLLIGARTILFYATHPNRLEDKEIALLRSNGDRILVRRK